MTNKEKQEHICVWVNPEERITVNFLNASDLNGEVTGCTDLFVDLSIETRVPHMRQSLAIPLSQVHVSNDLRHYTRDPNQPLQNQRLMLDIDKNRPFFSY